MQSHSHTFFTHVHIDSYEWGSSLFLLWIIVKGHFPYHTDTRTESHAYTCSPFTHVHINACIFFSFVFIYLYIHVFFFLSSDNSKGHYSYHTEWKGVEVMYHVSTLMPYNASDPDKVTRSISCVCACMHSVCVCRKIKQNSHRSALWWSLNGYISWFCACTIRLLMWCCICLRSSFFPPL